MKSTFLQPAGKAAILLALLALNADAATLYVDVNSANPVSPYAGWSTAATKIQVAINAATAGDTIWVTNGIYNTGGLVVGSTLSNRVAITKAVTVRSVNGPDVTIIEGYQVPGTTNGSSAVRCAWLTNGATLSGFQLTKGATMSGDANGAGAYCWSSSATLSNCVVQGNRVAGSGGGVYQGNVVHCVLSNNAAPQAGGGAYNAWLSDSTISGNAATIGGGISCTGNDIVISNCVIQRNTASSAGGGVSQGTVINSLIQSNTAPTGGGGAGAAFIGCTILRNSASQGGGISGRSAVNCRIIGNTGIGIYSSSAQNSVIMSNTPYGALTASLLNCTLVQNGVGLASSICTNCIVWFNTSPSTSPMFNCLLQAGDNPSGGAGNLYLYPGLLSDGWHLAPDSPGIGRGLTNSASGTDLDGQSWGNPPTIGCDEWNPQLLIVSQPRVMPASSPGLAVVQVQIAGATPYCWWTKDGASIIDGGRYSGAHTTSLNVTGFNVGDSGAYQVVASNSFGVVTSAVVTVSIACVDVASASPLSPYASWGSAAATIQDAVDAVSPGAVILVTNGLYATGGRLVAGDMSNRVVVDKAITVIGLSGRAATVIEGAWDPALTNGPASVRCAWLADGAVLGGFTIRNGSSVTNGGGVWCAGAGLSESVIGCVISNCSAAANGGGIYQGRLRQSVLTANAAKNGGGAALTVIDPGGQPGTASSSLIQSNTASSSGGGAYCGSVFNSTLQGNFASSGGGAYGAVVRNTLVQANQGGGVNGGSVGTTAVNCRIIANSGSGATSTILQNSFIQSNTPYGAAYCSPLNCTFVQNTVALYSAAATNCIFWFNGGGGMPLGYGPVNSCYSLAYNFPDAIASVTLYPNLLSDGWHLAADSPCIGRGVTNGASGTDFDGQAWGNPPSIGCDEWNPQPLIVSQPRVMPASTAGMAVVQVEIAGATHYCWWTKDGVAIDDGGRYSAAHTTSLKVTGLNVADGGAYQVIASNTFGVVTSAVVGVSIACVDAASANPVSPYTDWSTAAATIQDAVDVAGAGTVILVTNGVYATGGRLVAGDMFNRVVLDKAITVIGVNGPASTVIEGAWDPLTNGPASVRCAWLADGAVLGGLTLRNGSSITNGGGVWCTGFGLSENVIGCVITNCCAAANGGGAFQGRLRDCQIVGNTAFVNGGGAMSSFVDHGLVLSNSAAMGGGVYGGVARRCEILANTVSGSGGGAAGSALLLGCPVALNRARFWAGARDSTLYGCTVISNSAPARCAGVAFCHVWNSILYFNTGISDPTYGREFENAEGSGWYTNICTPEYRIAFGLTANPELLDLWHIAATSPCRGAGLGLGNAGFGDIDGESWDSPPAIGCDEPSDSGLTGPLSIGVAGWPEVAAGGTMPLTATIAGRAARLQWDYGDGVTATNVSFSTAHAWTNAGDYSVTATVFNADYPAGVAASVPVHVQPLVPPLLLSPVWSGPTFSMQLSAQPGLNYELQTATNLAAPVWKAIQSYYTPGGDITVMDTNATGTNRFYRLQIR